MTSAVKEFASKVFVVCGDEKREYKVIQFDGVDLLISQKDLKNIIQKSFEFTKEEDIKLLAHKLGIKLRHEQVLEERKKIHLNDDKWKSTGKNPDMNIDIRAVMKEKEVKLPEKKVLKFKACTLIPME